MTDDQREIRATLAKYEELLNGSDAESIAELYSTDGIFMPQGFPTAVGREAVLQSYRDIFKSIALTIDFEIEEIVADQEVAIALTRSNGSVRVNRTGDESPESNREIFVFARGEGAWRIARYMFNKAA